MSTSDPAPEPDDLLTPTEPQERAERLADLLRGLRRRLEGYQGVVEPSADDLATWDTVLYTYDDALVALADLLDLEVPAQARDEMDLDQRAHLEAAVTAAGIDLTAAPSDHSDG